MARLFIIMMFLLSVSHANSEKYFIKFGSFKNIRGLKQNISKLPNYLRSHVIIVRSHGWYVPFAYYTRNRSALYSKVSSYRRYFPDAHISHSASILNNPIVQDYSKTISVTRKTYHPYVPPRRTYVKPQTYQARQQVTSGYQNVAISSEDHILPPMIPLARSSKPTAVVSTTTIVPSVINPTDFDKVEIKQYKHFTKEMLSGHHYYLVYKSEDKNPNLLIKVSFKNNEVTYQPIIGDMKMTKANYLVDRDRLYMYTNAFTREGAFSKLEEHRDNHFLVSSWINGKKLNTLRYYYKLNDAKEYLGLETSKGLSEALQDGEFFWDKYR